VEDKPTLTVSGREGVEVVNVQELRVTLQGPGFEKVAVLGLDPLVVGTSPDCGLVCPDPSVSRRHCELRLTFEGVVIRDLESKNGTRVSGLKLREALLPMNLAVSLGSSRLWVAQGAKSAQVPLWPHATLGDAIGMSVAMRALFGALHRAAASEAPLLIVGESGTGKSLLARAVHGLSSRREGPFVIFDCAAVSPHLIESELFGFEKGAFTGASAMRRGLLEEAHLGTLVLEAVGDLPLELQPRLHRILEEKQFKRVGGNEWISCDLRVIATTQRDLKAMVEARAFREDLYYRLAVLLAVVPPLRARKEDLSPLVEHFLSGLKPPKRMADLPSNLLGLFEAYSWPGNLRELRNVVERMAIQPELGFEFLKDAADSSGVDQVYALPLREARDRVIDGFERRYLQRRIAECGTVAQAAQAMGVSRQMVYRLLQKHGIRVSDVEGD
jgi:transcriptional regulator with PAS, ATPase and Fis domain